MAVDIKDVEQVAQELQQKFDDFKAKNDKRVDAIEQEKGKLAGQVETLNGKLSELENLKSDLEKELLELKRPAGGAQNKLATEHKEAFVGFLRKGREDGLRDLERKALQVGTDEDGGYAVPEELDRNILNLLKDEVVMRQEATVITVGGSDYKKLVNLGGTASGWVGETDTRSQTATSRLELIEPLMGEIYGNPQATQKMLDDAFFNVEAWINSELATEFAEQEEIAFTSGDGTKKPKGFLAYESTDETDKVRAFGKLQHIVSGEATTVTADAIIKLIYTLRTRLPAPTTSAVMQNAAVGQSTTPAQSSGWPAVTHPVLNNAPAVKNTVDLPTWEELTDIRDTLNTAIDKELSRTTSDALFLALRRVKADLNADINTRLEQSARIIQRTPDEVLPALVLAATWFDNAARDADIIRRNAITHPGFVPVIPLKVPVQ
ncbi:phage major capsid protein [Escherichia coli]|nr:phage major capsid protein [Escherichia coli]